MLAFTGHYLLARLLWDDDFDAKSAEQRYHTALYGAAAPDAKMYYDGLEYSLRRVFLEGPGSTMSEPMIASFFNRYPGANNYMMHTVAAMLFAGRQLSTSPRLFRGNRVVWARVRVS